MAQMGVVNEVSMKSRKMIEYGDITETVLSMLKTEADTIFGEENDAKAESAMFMSRTWSPAVTTCFTALHMKAMCSSCVTEIS